MFEPTLIFFSKATIVNYKKVGTRFISRLAGQKEDPLKQMDILLKPTRTIQNSIIENDVDDKIAPYRLLNWGLTDKFICMPWHYGGSAMSHKGVILFDSIKNKNH